ncbi:MAG: helix-turn-helix transcriptional regulator, partial [Ruminococcus sp.]|nr:helix-turn-helix transcriptional regulator [Ruminococcus sp.]
ERLNVEYLDRICEYLNCSITDLIEYIPNEYKKTGKFLIKEEHGNCKK